MGPLWFTSAEKHGKLTAFPLVWPLTSLVTQMVVVAVAVWQRGMLAGRGSRCNARKSGRHLDQNGPKSSSLFGKAIS